MQKMMNIIRKAALAVISAVLASSCVTQKEQIPQALQNVMIQFNISAGQMTKAVTEAPTNSEGVIRSIRIFAFQEDRLAGHFFRANATSDPIFMDMLLPKTGACDIDFYVIANEAAMRLTATSPQISESMTKAQLASLAFDAVHTMSTYGMPMYATLRKTLDAGAAVQDLNTMPGHQGHMIMVDKVEVELTRPLAKISLYASKKEASASLFISDVTMLAGGTRQYAYLFEPDAATMQSVPSRANAKYLYSGSLEIQNFLASAADKQDASRYDAVFTDSYLPEVPFADGAERSVILNVAYSGGFGEIARNAIVNMPAIERNVHYKVYCSFASNGVMTVEFVVDPWTNAEMWDGGLVFDHPTHSFLLPDPTSHEYPAVPAQMTYIEGDDSGAFIGYFQMNYPANQSWMPTLFDGIADKCDVQVWDHTGTIRLTPSEYVSGDKWYMIKVVPEDPANVGGEVKLAITYRPVWSDEAEYLMINGTQSALVWPYAGSLFENDPNYVIITQK